MLTRTPLLEFSIRSDKKLAHYGGIYNRNQRRDMLNKWKGSPTSEGNKERGFGSPRNGRKIRLIPRGSGELRTDKGAPPGAGHKRRKSPFRKEARSQGRLVDSIDLSRKTLLLDYRNEE